MPFYNVNIKKKAVLVTISQWYVIGVCWHYRGSLNDLPNKGPVEVWEWISKFISYIVLNVVTNLSILGSKLNNVSEGGTRSLNGPLMTKIKVLSPKWVIRLNILKCHLLMLQWMRWMSSLVPCYELIYQCVHTFPGVLCSHGFVV